MKQTKRKKQKLKSRRKGKGKRKKYIARSPEAKENYKERFLEQLAKGRMPATAARITHIARSTAFGWKKKDEEFAAAWKDAIDAGVDEVETRTFERALDESSSDAQFILKHRRKEIYGNQDAPVRSGFLLNITLGEHYKQLERLGLPVPVLEGDYEEIDIIDAPSPTENDT